MEKKITVVIRVYNRIEDLRYNINIIKKFWKKYNYHIICVFNGLSDGYRINDEIKFKFDTYVEINENIGHISGNSQLLSYSLKYIPYDTDYVVILEADTWIFDDSIIEKYVKILDGSDYVWASAEWIEKYYTLALDFAIIKYNLLKNNPEIFNFTKHAESYVANYLINNGYKFIYIKEAMPVHIPSLLRKFYNPTKGRFRVFPKIKMVTHHVEEIENGMEIKKMYANIISKTNYFDLKFGKFQIFMKKLQLCIIYFILPIVPKSKWFKKKKMRIIQ